MGNSTVLQTKRQVVTGVVWKTMGAKPKRAAIVEGGEKVCFSSAAKWPHLATEGMLGIQSRFLLNTCSPTIFSFLFQCFFMLLCYIHTVSASYSESFWSTIIHIGLLYKVMHMQFQQKKCTHLIQHRLSLFFFFARKSDLHGSECGQSLTHKLGFLLFTPQVY